MFKPYFLTMLISVAEIEVWFDEVNLRIGESFCDIISKGIIYVDFVIIILSKNSVKSRWIKYELGLALTKEINQIRVVVLPIVIDDYEIPFSISSTLDGDFRNPVVFATAVK